jgi:hypothetical protein
LSFAAIAAVLVDAISASPQLVPPNITDVAELRASTPAEEERARRFEETSPAGLLTVDELLKNGSNRSINGRNPAAQGLFALPGYVPTIDDRLRAQFCPSQVVVVGTPISRRVFLSERGSTLFTDYVVRIAHWIKPAAGPSEEVFSSGGGIVVFNGQEFSIDSPSRVAIGYESVFAGEAFHSTLDDLGVRLWTTLPAENTPPDLLRRVLASCAVVQR